MWLELARALMLILIGACLTVIALTHTRKRAMTQQPCFDPNDPDHVMSLAQMLNEILNASGRFNIKFALIIWQDRHDEVQGLISNDTNDRTVVEMLDGAKGQINRASGVIHNTVGHA